MAASDLDISSGRSLRLSAVRCFLLAAALLATLGLSRKADAFNDRRASAPWTGEAQGPADIEPTQWLRPFARVVLDLLDELSGRVEQTALDDLAAVLKYNRLQHFGTWISGQDPNHPCRNTRAVVLVRDSVRPQEIEYKDSRECAVVRSRWDDPYTGSDRSESVDVQIDHVVPLKNAFLLGAHRWSGPRRCHYANYIGNAYHLLTVDASENMSKGDRSPDRYLPPNSAYQCAYASIWMRIKRVWGLKVTPDELSTLRLILKDCPASFNAMTETELNEQVAAIREIPDACRDD